MMVFLIESFRQFVLRGPVMRGLRISLRLLVLMSLSGCAAQPDFDACRYRGNAAGEKFCSISYIYLMSHPEKFDSRDVEFFAWVRVVDGAALVFPTREAMEDGESVSSMVIYGDEVVSSLRQRNLAARVVIRGKFHLSKGRADPLDIDRIGVIQDAKVLP